MLTRLRRRPPPNLDPEFDDDDDQIDQSKKHQWRTIQVKVFSTPVITDEILNYLNPADLKVGRLVDSRWLDIFTAHIRRKDIFVVSLYYSTVQKKFFKGGLDTSSYHIAHSIMDEFTLSKLSTDAGQSLAPGRSFPCTSFSLSGGNLGGLDGQRFFQTQGQQIRSLSLSATGTVFYGQKDVTCQSCPNWTGQMCRCPRMAWRTLQLILAQLSHGPLERLHVSSINCPIDLENGLGSLSSIKLTCLKHFYWRRAESIAQVILKISPNLTNLDFCPQSNRGDSLKHVVRAGRVKAVKKLIFCLNWIDQKAFEEFCEGQPELTHLSILTLEDSLCIGSPHAHRQLVDLAPSEWTGSINKLLEFSKNSLEFLDLSGLCTIPGIMVPKCGGVSTFHLMPCCYSMVMPPPCCCWLRDLNLGNKFPRLTTLDLNGFNQVLWDDYFPSKFYSILKENEAVSMVTTLRLRGKCSDLWMTRLKEVFPNFKHLHLTIYGHNNVQGPMAKVFGVWSHLETIHFVITNGQWELGSVEKFDSAITGMEVELCKKLRHDNDSGHRHLDVVRNLPSLLDLKDLKMVKFDFYNFRTHHILLSWVSQKYAFDLIPQLRVAIGFVCQMDCCSKMTDLVELRSKCHQILPQATVNHQRVNRFLGFELFWHSYGSYF